MRRHKFIFQDKLRPGMNQRCIRDDELRYEIRVASCTLCLQISSCVTVFNFFTDEMILYNFIHSATVWSDRASRMRSSSVSSGGFVRPLLLSTVKIKRFDSTDSMHFKHDPLEVSLTSRKSTPWSVGYTFASFMYRARSFLGDKVPSRWGQKNKINGTFMHKDAIRQ